MSNENFSIHGYNLVTLLKRLETATSRLEDVTIFQENLVSSNSAQQQPSATGAVPTAKAISTQASSAPAPVPAPVPAPAAPKPVEQEIPRSIKEFDNLIADYVDVLVANSKKIDPLVLQQAELFKKAFIAERNFLLAASQSKKVELTDKAFQEAITPINKEIMAIGDLKDKNRPSKFYNNLNTVAEGSPALGWIYFERI
ncbi:unnamed protein product [Ambrosiozyma monospora]|uniref:Unnamed protein product n=1 Tax=Ambrosiozyma monospora TaxID=43982 RepID=A0ACB5TDD9_AMBMO|nr:unnamed protein product [Ambrosiozyma monospora]